MIDAHQHFWQLGRNDCTWPTPELTRIFRDYGPDDLAPLASRTGVTGTILVQSQPSDRDTDYLLALARETPLIKAVVGWVDLKATHAPERIAALSTRHPKLRGLRPMLQDLDSAWILDPQVEPAITAMIDHGLCFDALLRPRHLQDFLRFAQRNPELPIVIDHGAKPDIAHGILDPWRQHMRSLAALPHVFCKLSGLVTEASPLWKAADLAPYVAHLVECFGHERLMWGSDWPVLELASSYAEWLSVAQSLIAEIDPNGAGAVFGETATRFYKLNES